MKTRIGKIFLVATALLLSVSMASAQATINVTVNTMSFSPANITIDLGDTVRWTNNGNIHNVNGTTVTYASNPESFGNALGTPFVFDHKFMTAGTYDYRCDQHFGSGMVGTITVVDPAAGIEEATQNAGILNIYPVPSTNELTIELSNSLFNQSAELEVIVFDLNGKEVLRKGNITESVVKLNTAELKNSTYFIHVTDGTTVLEKRSISISK